ncbi:MAG: M24 family metallopeptidase C-terminal domain-containing protein [Flavobacteriaceae bacterium]|nr:M24 family metallopeptidase C-terminal domain-containing protein [Flavobacteriaceae bacterium]
MNLSNDKVTEIFILANDFCKEFENTIAKYRIGKTPKKKPQIRHENLILCVEDEVSDFGVFLAHETLTLCPFYTEPILKELLNEDEIDWLNAYHKKVYDVLSPCLERECCEWLKEKCRAVYMYSSKLSKSNFT